MNKKAYIVCESLPCACDALNLSLPTELAVRADLERDTRHLVGERAQLVHHCINGVLKLENLACKQPNETQKKA